MAVHPILATLVTAAPTAAPNLEAAIATAYDWHQSATGLYAFASNGGQGIDEATRQAALQEVEQSLAWVRSQQAEIDSGKLPEFKADLAAAQQQGISPTDYLTQRLENLKAVLNQGAETEAPPPAPEPPPPTQQVPPAELPAAPGGITGSVKTARVVVSVEVFNQARAIAQNMLQKLEGTDSELEQKVHDILFELNETETQAGDNLTEALDDQLHPESARNTLRMIKLLSSLQREVASAPEAPELGQEHDPSETPAASESPAMATASLKVQSFLQQAKLLTPASRIKTATNGAVHVTGLKPGIGTLGQLVKFASQNKIAVRLVKAFEDEDESASCPQCGGPGVPLGALGSKKHYRCRDCGVGFNHEDEQAPKFAAAEDTLHPERPTPEELPFDEGAVAARTDPTVPDALGVTAAAGPEPEDHVLKAGDQYLAFNDDPQTGEVKISLVPSQKQAEHMGHSLAALWMADDRLSNFIASEVPEGQAVRVVRVVPKKPGAVVAAQNSDGYCPICNQADCHGECSDNKDHQEETSEAKEWTKNASVKIALPLPPPTANGNHAGPANPVNPTGAPAPGTPASMVAPAIPSSQGPAVTHTNPGTPPAPVQPPMPGGIAPAPQLGPNGQPLQASAKTACDGNCKGDCPNCKKKKEAAGMNQDDFPANWRADAPTALPAGQDPGEPPAQTLPQRNEFKVTFSDGDYLVTGFNGTIEEAQAYYVGHDFNLGSGGNDKMVKGVSVEQLGGKEASAKTADNGMVSAMAREVVLSWMSGHPRQQPDWASPDWKQLWEQNRADCPDENLFIQACQKAYAEMSKSLSKGAKLVAALALKARGLRGPSAEKGDTLANAVKFMKGNAKDLEDETIGSLRQLLADAGYSRPVVELAIEERFGEDATLANGARLKDLLTDED